MKKLLTVLMFVGVLAVALWALPIQAEMVSVGDSELSAISGKDNSNTDAGSLTMSAGDGNIQVGYYQWIDLHSTDASNNKGGNNQSGATSAVQENVVAEVNAISWGALAQGLYISAGNVTDNGVDQEAWATLFIGGF